MAGDIDDNKALAILSYIGILFLVPMLAAPKSQFAQYHAKQGMILFITSVILYLVFYGLAFVSIGLIGFLSFIPWLFVVIWSILGIVNAINGEEKPLPVIGTLIKK